MAVNARLDRGEKGEDMRLVLSASEIHVEVVQGVKFKRGEANMCFQVG